MDPFILKLVLTPLFIGVATLAVRRWGFMLGGLFTGLPLTSGPVSLFLALERGPGFAEQGSHGMLLGTIALVAFCVAYAWTARGLKWITPATIGLCAYSLTAWGLSFVSSSLMVLALITLLFLWVAVKALGPPVSTTSPIDARWWDIPLRMTTATAMVLLITGGAEHIGPQWSGILAPFPVFTCIMGVFAQKQNGAAAVHGLLRGIMIGCFSAVSFYVIVGLTVEHTSIIITFLLASAVSLAVNGICLFVLLRNKPCS
jgi:hypothetical protein